jgi:N-acetyl-anhydromuramyl-L-alanine amidase AmpD
MFLPVKLEGADFSFLEKFKKNVVGRMTAKGATLHYTASDNLSETVSYLLKKNLGYHIIIDRDGKTYQLADFNQKLWHAGKAFWNILSPNSYHIGIALMSWGKLTFVNGSPRNWAGKEVKDYAKRNNKYWHIATEEQEEALYSILQFLVQNGIDPKNICSHEECALPKGRKEDIGGVISMTMENIREVLKKDLPLTNNIA